MRREHEACDVLLHVRRDDHAADEFLGLQNRRAVEDFVRVGVVLAGGAVEDGDEVVVAAQAAMKTGAPRMLEFGVSNEDAWEVGLACGGTVRIFVEPVQ